MNRTATLAWLRCISACWVCLLPMGAAAAAPPGYYLVWVDDFDGTSLDGSKWSAWSGPNRHAVNVPDAVRVQGGYLTITTFTTNGTHYTAIVSSDGKFRCRYGYLEARIQFNTTPGMWSAFWLQSPTGGQHLGDPSASGAELDICEHRKEDRSGADISGQVQTTVHWDGYGADHKQVHGGNIGSGLGSGFHTYGLLWDTTSYSFIIDDARLWGTNAGHSDRTGYVLLSSEVQSNFWAGMVPPGGYGNFLTSTTRMVLDYVRYYAPTTTVFWTGATSTNWAATGNWLQGRTPHPGDEVVFSYWSTGNLGVALGQDAAIGGLSIQEAGPVSVNVCTLTVSSGGIDMLSATSDAAINSALVLGVDQTWRIAGGRILTINGTVSGSGNLTLGSRGAVALAATNAHRGTITVSSGSLVVSGVTGTNTVAVAGGTLTGGGLVLGPVVISAGGTLAPGMGIGTLTISNRLTLQAGGLTVMEINRATGASDQVRGMRSVAYGGMLVLNNQAGTVRPEDAFKLFDAQHYAGAFARISPLTPGTNLIWDTTTLVTDGTLWVKAAPPGFSLSRFTRGDLVVLQVGSGTIDNAGAPGFLNEYSPAGGPCLWQLALPSTGTNALVFGPSAYGGGLTRSADGKSLVLAGYNAPAGSCGTGSIESSSTTGSPAVLRAVGVVDAAATFTLHTTTTRFSGSSIRSAVSDGRGSFWAGGGSGGAVYLGIAAVPTTVTTISSATRSLGLFDGRLCFTQAGSEAGVMGFLGLPTAAAVPVMLISTAGLGTGTPSPKGFVFNPGSTVAYVADNRSASSGGGLQRFNWTGTAWVYAYTLGCTVGASQQVWDVAADFSGQAPILYAVTGESSGTHLVTVTDTGAGAAFRILATAPSGSAFRGVTFAPTQASQ